MKAAVLCPGPSLLKTAPYVTAELLIGVNRAPYILQNANPPGWNSRAIHWHAFDPRSLIHRPSYSPLLFSREYSVLWAQKVLGIPLKLDKTHESLEAEYPLDWHWTDRTFSAAMVLSASLGAKEIVLYGSDWTGNADADGVTLPSNNRSPERWAEERSIYDLVSVRLQERGVVVRRILLCKETQANENTY